MPNKNLKIIHRNFYDQYDLNFGMEVLEGPLTLDAIEKAIDQIQTFRSSEVKRLSVDIDDLKDGEILDLIDKINTLEVIETLELQSSSSPHSVGAQSLKSNLRELFDSLISHKSLRQISLNGFVFSEFDYEIMTSSISLCTLQKSFRISDHSVFKTVSDNILNKLKEAFDRNLCSFEIIQL